MLQVFGGVTDAQLVAIIAAEYYMATSRPDDQRVILERALDLVWNAKHVWALRSESSTNASNVRS